ncbi:MAG TPA: NAD(P)H-binding protein, partial [Candidatus Binatia bacterium]|nr:NAD(P)H-binding protein [Candidatus Binatia bacterium]
MQNREKILLTGATGYVGGRLLRALENRGLSLRCLARKPENLRGRVAPTTEIACGDCLDLASLRRVMSGIETAYYLVHSMGSAGSFEDQDRRSGDHFAQAAREMGVRRIIYLGGLGEGSLSPHLRSRQEVGERLQSSGVEVVEFRASIVIGSGSLSFEIIRALVERLPVMVCPRWVSKAAQPIGIEDLTAYLLAALDLPYEGSRIIEIGGPERVSYRDIMKEYAQQRGLHRVMIPVPVLSPRLSSLWLGLVTPVYARIGRKLIDSIRNSTVVKDPSALTLFAIRPKGLSDMITRAMQNEDSEFAVTRWSDALSSTGLERSWGGVRLGNRLVDSHAVAVAVPAEEAFRPICRIGG